MAFKQSELPQNVKEEFDLYDKAKEQAMGLATFLGGFMLPGSAGLTYPKSVAKTIPASTQLAASQSRRMMYGGLKSDIQDIIANPKKYEKLFERIGITKSKAVERGLADYKERIKAVTALPDSIIARVRGIDPPMKGAVGSWDEIPTGNYMKDRGGRISITPHEPGQAASIIHEGTHGAHGVMYKLYEAAKVNPQAAKIWETVPQGSKDVIQDLYRIDKFHRKWFTQAGRKGAQRYEAFYNQWPAEKLAEQAPDAVLGLASKLGRRLTTDEYLQAIKPIASKLQPNVRSLEKKFHKIDELVKKSLEQ